MVRRRSRQAAREERKAQRRTKSGGETSSSDVRSLVEEELKSYEKHEEIVSGGFNVLRWWKAAGTATLDRKENILEAAKFPLLSCVASALFSINSTSCESERDFSALSLSLSKMRHSLKDKKVEKMMFLRLNAERVPEIRGIKEELRRAVEERSAGQKETKRVQAKLSRTAMKKAHNVEIIDDE